MKNSGGSEHSASQRRNMDGFELDEHRDGAGTTDEQLLSAFLAGDDEAFSTLVRRYGRSLFQFVARFVRDVSVAEDVVQETFLQVHQSAAGFDPDRRLRPWLFTIAANKARDHIRGRARKREVSISTNPNPSEGDTQVSFVDLFADEQEMPDAVLDANEQKEVVRRIVSEMPDHLREVLVLGYYQRFPYKEIAEILDIPLGTVKSRLHAAVAYFAAAYQKELDK